MAMPIHIGTQARLLHRFGKDIDRVSENPGQATLQPG